MFAVRKSAEIDATRAVSVTELRRAQEAADACLVLQGSIEPALELFDRIEAFRNAAAEQLQVDPEYPLTAVLGLLREVYSAWENLGNAYLADAISLQESGQQIAEIGNLKVAIDAARERSTELWEVPRDWVGPGTEDTARVLRAQQPEGMTDELWAELRVVMLQNATALRKLA